MNKKEKRKTNTKQKKTDIKNNIKNMKKSDKKKAISPVWYFFIF